MHIFVTFGIPQPELYKRKYKEKFLISYLKYAQEELYEGNVLQIILN